MEGTLRANLDPHEIHPDRKIAEALKRVRFYETLEQDLIKEGQSPGQPSKEVNYNSMVPYELVNFKIASKGSNLSSGQRQLVCLARALLNKARIILIDEIAEDGQDNDQTTEIIQGLIRSEEMQNTTILTVCHRLKTVANYEHVVVMDRGVKREEGSVRTLIDRKGVLYSMLEEAGLSQKLF